MKFTLKFFGYLLPFIFILVGCGTTSQIYLQSARHNCDESYGIYKHNPILLKCSKNFEYDAIIENYIDRLFISAGDNLQKFSIISRETILENGAKAEISSIKDKKGYLDKIFIYKIISENKKVSYTLYFKLTRKKEKLYIPHGLLFSMLCGE